MSKSSDAVRDHLARVLEWEDAHVGFDAALDGLAHDHRGVRPPGFEHSAWQIVEHIRIAQDDILDFCVNANYAHTRNWPADYWPADPAPPDDATWKASLVSYTRTRAELKRLVHAIPDLGATVPTGKEGQTYLRAILLVADHTAYHVGQLVALRRAMGRWK